MRVLLVGGSDVRFRLPLADEYASRGVDVTIAGSDTSALLGEGQHQFVPWASSVADVFLPWSSAVREIRNISWRLSPDIVHVFDTIPGLVVSRARLGGTVVRTVTGRGRVYRPSGSSIGLTAYRGMNRLLRHGVQEWVFQNELDRRWFIAAGISEARCSHVVAGSGVDLSAFPPQDFAEARLRVRDELDLSVDDVMVLLAARLVPKKGVDLFVDASQEPTCRAAVFVLAGVFPKYRSRPRLDSVVYLEERSDMPRILAAADIVVLPTRYGEGLPRILLEAAATGLPLVATDAPGCAEVVLDGTTGYLVESSVNDIATAVGKLIDDPELRSRFGGSARRHVASGFSVGDVASQYLSLYSEAVQ